MGSQRGFAPHFGLLKILLLEHHVTTRKRIMMQKGVITRGGVEDTRLDAKAKDTKKTEAKAKT